MTEAPLHGDIRRRRRAAEAELTQPDGLHPPRGLADDTETDDPAGPTVPPDAPRRAARTKLGVDWTAGYRKRDEVAAAVASGAVAAQTVAEAVARAEVVITMLPAGQHVLSVYFGPDGVAAHAAEDTRPEVAVGRGSEPGG